MADLPVHDAPIPAFTMVRNPQWPRSLPLVQMDLSCTGNAAAPAPTTQPGVAVPGRRDEAVRLNRHPGYLVRPGRSHEITRPCDSHDEDRRAPESRRLGRRG